MGVGARGPANLAEAQEKAHEEGREEKGNEQKREKAIPPPEPVGVPIWVLSPGRGLSEGGRETSSSIQEEGLETPREGTARP